MTAISADSISEYPYLQDAGLFHRRTRAGKEKDLVLNYLESQVTPPPPGQVRFSFVEPRMETGFPDLVVVYVDAEHAKAWDVRRSTLGKSEIQLLHLLARERGQLETHLRFLYRTGLDRILRRLSAAGLISKVNSRWIARPTRELLSLRRIVAIEAKISAWRQGLNQAISNQWFASESYLLLPRVPVNSHELRAELELVGVGLLTRDTPLRLPAIRAARRRLPGSYASWLFNEWSCKAFLPTESPICGEDSPLGYRAAC